MADTAENQAAFPQPRTQAAGLGSPLCPVVALICLGSGAVIDAAICPYLGKGHDEQTLLHGLLDQLVRGDVLLGDAFYSTYFLLAELVRRGVDGVFEQYGARRRSTDFERGYRLGPRDHLILIKKPAQRPYWMTPSQYQAAPDTLAVRELRVSGKTLVTTLFDTRRTLGAELRALYRQRWHIELDLRNLKGTLGMDRLRCKTPDMAIKGLWVYLLAHNLIRRLMARAAVFAKTAARTLSFKHTVQLWLAWHHRGLVIEDDDQQALILQLVAQRRVGRRPVESSRAQ